MNLRASLNLVEMGGGEPQQKCEVLATQASHWSPRLSLPTVHFMALCPLTTSAINVLDVRFLTLSPRSAVTY